MGILRYRGQWTVVLDGEEYPVVHDVDWNEETNFHSCHYAYSPKADRHVKFITSKRKVVIQKSWVDPNRVRADGERAIECYGYIGVFNISNVRYIGGTLTFNTELYENLVAAHGMYGARRVRAVRQEGA